MNNILARGREGTWCIKCPNELCLLFQVPSLIFNLSICLTSIFISRLLTCASFKEPKMFSTRGLHILSFPGSQKVYSVPWSAWVSRCSLQVGFRSGSELRLIYFHHPSDQSITVFFLTNFILNAKEGRMANLLKCLHQLISTNGHVILSDKKCLLNKSCVQS